MAMRWLLHLNQGIARPAATGQLLVQSRMAAGPDSLAAVQLAVRAVPDTGNLYERRTRRP